jgi:hypothetical protein
MDPNFGQGGTMRVLVVVGALVLVACSSPPPPSTHAQQLACVVCPGIAQPIWQNDVRVIAPELDPAEIARRIGRPDLEAVLEEKIVAAEARVASAPSDDQARVIVDSLLVDLNRIARPL